MGKIVQSSEAISNHANIDDYEEQLIQIGQHLTEDGDILLYGCEVAKGETGQAFIERLSQLIGADVAASANLTGSEDLGGDWLLEVHMGAIQTKSMQLSYDGVLATFTGTDNADLFTGTAGDDIFTGNLGDDKLTGAEGDDVLNGGEGYDTAVYLGNKADYQFSVNSTGQITVQDINMADGNEGTDTLTGVEVASFAEGPFTLSMIGGTTRVNTYTAGNQAPSSVARLADGGYVVLWSSWDQNGPGSDIYGQRYAANGTPQGDEFFVNTATVGDQMAPSVAALPNGGYVAVWRSNNMNTGETSIVAQQYTADNAKAGSETTINSATGIAFPIPLSLAALSDGGYVVAWGQDGNIFARHYSASNVPVNPLVIVSSNSANGIGHSSVATLPNGGYIVTWASNDLSTQTASIFTQQYAANDIPVGSPITISAVPYSVGWVGEASIATTSDGGYAMTWLSVDSASNTTTLFTQRYDANNMPVNPPSSIANTSGWMVQPSIAILSDGGYVVTWMLINPATNTTNIVARQYDAAGIAKGSEFVVSTATAEQNQMPSIAALSDGGFVISWDAVNPNGTLTDVYSQRYDANGNPVQQTVLLAPQNTSNTAPQLTGAATKLADGVVDTNYIVTTQALIAGWTDAELDTLSITQLASDHGAVTKNSNGTYTIIPETSYESPRVLWRLFGLSNTGRIRIG